MQARHGITYDLVWPGYSLRNILHFLRVYCSVLFFRRRNSCIVFLKVYSRGIYASALKLLLRLRGKGTIYDLDDAEYLRHPPQTIQFFLRHCAQVHVGSAALEDYARNFNPHVRLLTSPVIAHGQERPLKSPGVPLHLGWIGFYNAHRKSLETLLFPALEGLPFPVRLTLLGVDRAHHRLLVKNLFQSMPHVELDMPAELDWQDEGSIYARIREWDLGIAPLLDTPLNRAKSAFKLKQCLSCGVPVLASPVGENLQFLAEGVNGAFFSDAGELREKLVAFREMDARQWQSMRSAALDTFARFGMEGYVRTFLGEPVDDGAMPQFTAPNAERKPASTVIPNA